MKSTTKHIKLDSYSRLIKTYSDLLQECQSMIGLEKHDVETVDYGFGITAIRHNFEIESDVAMESYTISLITDITKPNGVELKKTWYDWDSYKVEHHKYTVE